ncbi:hypothetical protein COT12_01250 [Candidatus Berkelbacteria bacterium CG08_land_8_20_14_0_20_39_8]|uniref:Uncharacterized protein n=1 Tax=Candidatus Berkelbacteria bacterium CG08_land_8_20_14_0_20_39_8 TaxID=1974511 RepID=A0A2M6YCI1_9BACT|nr:MAG: hypothetical protein COT12_01250 [Candidatus Berkelbacteria bacterium CG08_land_8_20_14_0_20_39_8]
MPDDKLTEEITKLEKATRRANNLGWMILKGIFYSIGWVFGLALIAVILYYLLPRIGDGNIIGRFIHAMADAIRQNK